MSSSEAECGFSSLFCVVGFGDGVSGSLDTSLPPLGPSLRIQVTPQHTLWVLAGSSAIPNLLVTWACGQSPS